MAEKQLQARVAGPELRLVDRRAFVGFPELQLAPGVVITDFALSIPGVTFPMNLSGGAAKYQKKKLDFGFLELTVDAEVLQREVRAHSAKLQELDDVRLHFRPGHLEVQARLRGPERTPVTFKAAFDGDGEKLAIYLYDVRLYAYSPVAACRLGALVSEAVASTGALPEVERRGANGLTARVLPMLVEAAAVSRGYKLPSLDQARLAHASITSKGLVLRFSSGGLPPPGAPDEELLLALEGARAFADAEELVAQNKLVQAREAYLRLGDAAEAHPFAAERLLTLLVADPQSHELALDIASSLARRRERSATALWAEAVVRERRGEFAKASERFLALCQLARTNQEEAGAFFAAEAAARSSRDHAPQLAVKALHELLGLKPDHLPSLKALARAADLAKDRAGAIRAYRRLAALARDAADAAEAHVQLARLSAQTEDDVSGARLHCEAALRLAPDHPEALSLLGELCYRSGEWLRAIKALDRVREVAMARHEVDRVGRANLLAGLVWETGLKQPENALLRFHEAASLLPGEPEPHYLSARVAESLGRFQEAVAGYQQSVELAGPAPRTDEIRKAAHASHHALARLLKAKLGEPARAREHLEAALLLDPQDQVALDELLPYFRASGRAAELADACEKAAAVATEPARRAALWAEAGELCRGRLNQPDKAERLLGQALEADSKNRVALEGLLAIAESKRDGGQLVRCLEALAQLSEDAGERARHYRRLVVAARDLAFDLDGAVRAAREVLKIESDDLPMLGELTALERRRSDMAGLAWALEQRARVAEGAGDKRLSAAALRELSQVLDTRLGRSGESLVALEKACRLFPEVNALLELATLSLRLERPLNARRALEDVLALLPRHAPPEKLAEVRARLGRACELLGDRDAAKENYALAFPLRRLDDELAARLEVLYAEDKATRELTDLWAARAQALLQAGRALDAAPLFFKSAQTLLEAGDTQGAILRLNAALDAAPSGAKAGEALEALAKLEVDRGALQEAARLYGRRATLAADAHEAARWYFRASTLTRETPREQPFITQALEKDPSFIPARLRRAELIEESNPREALADFEAVLSVGDGAKDEAGDIIDLVALTRRAAHAALKASHYDQARRLFSRYVALKPDDIDAQLELAKLHRRAGALEPLVDLLGELWPRLTGSVRQETRREFTEGALSLGRSAAALEALRAMLADEPNHEWAASRLLTLLPNDEAHQSERLELLSRLVSTAAGEARAELLSRRAEIYRVQKDLTSARGDLQEAARASANPVPLLRTLAELSRLAGDEAAELSALKQVLSHAQADESVVTAAAERLLSIARSRARAEDAPRAIEAFEALVKLPLPAEGRTEAWLGLAQVAKGAGDSRRAESALLEASKQGPVPRRVEALLERAQLLSSRGATQDAIEAWSGVLELAPRQPQATAGLIAALRKTEDWSGLAEVLAAESAHLPKDRAAPLLVELSALYLDKLGDTAKGEAALRRVVAADEADVASRRRLSALLAAKGDARSAIELLESAAATLAPAEAAATLREAAALADTADSAREALRLRRAAHALAPATGEELSRLADALYMAGGLGEALPLQRMLAAQVSFHDTPDVAERVWLRLAELAEETGDAALAESTLRRVVTERPLNSQAVERLAALVSVKDARAGFELRARWAQTLSKSPRTAEILLSLAREATAAHDDSELAAALLAKAAQATDEPLAVRVELAKLLRDQGRVGELMAELAEIAQLQLTSGDVEGALVSWSEEARLAEGNGRIDDALRTLSAMADVCADEGREEEAGRHFIHAGELLRDSKLDVLGAAQAFDKAWPLAPSLQLAKDGLALARRRADRESELDWQERVLGLLPNAAEQANAFVELARLHLGLPADGGDVATAPMLSPDQAEAALQQALTRAPGHAAAETLLLALYERQDRTQDIAAHYESAAQRTADAGKRAELLLNAAQLYKEKAGRPHEAAAALLAARAANPDDLTLTARVADELLSLGRRQDAADFDAVLLEQNPLHASFERHAEWLRETEDNLSLAAVLSRRAEATEGKPAAQLWLEAAAAFREAGAVERAQVAEAQAFEAAPTHRDAFLTLLGRAKDDPRRQAELLLARANAVPDEASSLLKQRAQLLSTGEPLLAAEAWDVYLSHAPDDVDALLARATLAAQGDGARASQPFDRRLVQLADDALPAATRLTVWTRLGHAAIEAQAWRDAIDAFETAYAIEPTREALSSLDEAYAQANDTQGRYRTTMRLAALATGDEAQSLHRRALALVEQPQDALDALEALLAHAPGDEALYEKGEAAYRALGRLGELVSLHEKFAQATGGQLAAHALLKAAKLAEEELGEGQRAYELKQAAHEADGDDVAAAEALLVDARARGDVPRVEAVLVRLAALTPDDARAAELKLELAAIYESRQQYEAAKSPLAALHRAGPSAPGYAQALAGLERIARAEGDTAALTRVLTDAASLVGGADRAARLLDAARAAQQAGDTDNALKLTRESLNTRASTDGFTLLVDVARSSGRHDELARALTQLAEQNEGAGRAALLLQALDAWREAGELDSAREVLERVLRETPGVVAPEDAAARFTKLNAPVRALEVGFAPALRAGRFENAIALAEAANDRAKLREALQRAAEHTPSSEAAGRYVALLREARDVDALRAFSQLAPEQSVPLRLELAVDFGETGEVDGLVHDGAGLLLLNRALGEKAPGVLTALLPHHTEFPAEQRLSLFTAVAATEPSRKGAMLRAIASLHREEGNQRPSLEALDELVTLEEDAKARAALHLERGALHKALEQHDDARLAFERALADDAQQLAAVTELIPLYEGRDDAQFIAMVERLAALTGEAPAAKWNEPLAAAYERQGRDRDAYRLLAQLDETPERIASRIALAQKLELHGDAFTLQEKVAQTREEFEAVLAGYLQTELVPFAVKLGERLLDEGPLPAPLTRKVGEALASTQQGAHLSARVWPGLLRQHVNDTDGWTYFAEALRTLKRDREAAVVDGFGAALSATHGHAPRATGNAVTPVFGAQAAPASAQPVTEQSMPRLHAALRDALTQLGAASLPVVLDIDGGVEAWLSDSRLVLGAGALTVFGEAELPALLAFALAAGAEGVRLREAGELPGFGDIAVRAFTAWPASLAFCRVLAQLEVRGEDPSKVDVSAVLRESDAFHAVAISALDSVS